MICERCHKNIGTYVYSWLNMDKICLDCAKKEETSPTYNFAKEVERKYLQNGNTNFPGVLYGMTGSEDEKDLMARVKFGDTPENIHKAFEKIVNNILFSGVNLANTFKKNNIDFVNESLSWVSYMAQTDRIDERNRASSTICKELVKDGKVVNVPPTNLVKIWMREHRTLQQAFTAFCLSYLGFDYSLPFI